MVRPARNRANGCDSGAPWTAVSENGTKKADMTDMELWTLFTTSRLPAEAWTHRAHLRVAWMFLHGREPAYAPTSRSHESRRLEHDEAPASRSHESRRLELDEAHLLMRAGIVRLNASHGLVETPVRGYHETVTRVWLALVQAARGTASFADASAFVDHHHEAALHKDAPLRHYTRELLASTAARACFVDPDRAPLP
jgi:hypothetical protein